MGAIVPALSLGGIGQALGIAGQVMSLFGGSSAPEAPPPQLIDYKPLEKVEGQGITNVPPPSIGGIDTSEMDAQERKRRALAQSQTQTAFAPAEEAGPKTSASKSLLGE